MNAVEGVAGAPTLSQLWEWRNLGKVAESYQGFQEWRAVRGLGRELPPPDMFEALLVKGLSPDESLSYCLLGISFLRNQLRFADASALLLRLEDRVAAIPTVRRFELIFQKANNAFATGEFSVALDLFIEARQLAESPLEKCWVQYNLIVVMDELGMETSRMLGTFLSLIPTLEEKWRSFFEGKIRAVKMRLAFREGDIASFSAVPLESLDDYSRYFLCWCRSLPFLEIRATDSLPSDLIAGYAETGPQWLAGYRMRTLRGLLLEADLGARLPLAEAVERFYLWTWRWLAAPTAEALSRVLEFRRRLLPGTNQLLSSEHRLMLDNALRWLGLFAFVPDIELQNSTYEFKSSLGAPSILLDYERYALDYWMGVRTGNDTIAADTRRFLKSHAAHQLPGFLLPEFLESVIEGKEHVAQLAPLASSLTELFPRARAKLASGLLVHALDRKIRVVEKGHCREEIAHAGIVSLSLLVQEKTSFSKVEILRYCFGLPRYDAYLHDTKIANLLSQANRVFAGIIRFSCKGEIITASVLSPERLRFEGGCRHSRLLSGATADPALLLGTSARLGETERPKKPAREWEAISQDWLPRTAIERWLGVSKATATRRLNTWLEENLVERRGRGRDFRYKVTPKLISKMKQEGMGQ